MPEHFLPGWTALDQEVWDSHDQATKEQLWRDPNWKCPRCESVNRAIRHSCGGCNYIGGELAIHEVGFLPGLEAR